MTKTANELLPQYKEKISDMKLQRSTSIAGGILLFQFNQLLSTFFSEKEGYQLLLGKKRMCAKRYEYFLLLFPLCVSEAAH